MNTRVTAITAILCVALSLPSLASSPSGATSVHVAPRISTLQYGLDTLVLDGCQDSTTWSTDAVNQMQGFKQLGANSVGITFPLYTDSGTSNNFYGKLSCDPAQNFHTPSPARLAVLVDAAHQVGLNVLFRPFLDQENLVPNYWRGNIAPANPTAWFTSYKNALMPYLKMAQAHKVEHFAISTELSSMARYSNWTGVIKAARAAYKGNLVFTFSWKRNNSEVRPNFTTPAMDTYPALTTLSNKATQRQVLAAWNKRLQTSDPLPWISSVVDHEVGIPAQDNAYGQPFAHPFPLSTNPFNQAIQVKWFTAACAFAKQHKMKGIYFWGTVFTDHGGKMLTAPDPAASGEIQPLTQPAVKACFRS